MELSRRVLPAAAENRRHFAHAKKTKNLGVFAQGLCFVI
jgi:hypothetical protein